MWKWVSLEDMMVFEGSCEIWRQALSAAKLWNGLVEFEKMTFSYGGSLKEK